MNCRRPFSYSVSDNVLIHPPRIQFSGNQKSASTRDDRILQSLQFSFILAGNAHPMSIELNWRLLLRILDGFALTGRRAFAFFDAFSLLCCQKITKLATTDFSSDMRRNMPLAINPIPRFRFVCHSPTTANLIPASVDSLQRLNVRPDPPALKLEREIRCELILAPRIFRGIFAGR
jgi:hypothetical protein